MCRLSVEDEYLESTYDRALSIDGDPMWILQDEENDGTIGD
jgi:hypothetical protein